MWCSNKWLFFFFFLQIVTVISSSEVFLHNGPHGPLLWEPSKFELLPSSVSPQSQNQSACQNNRHSGKKTQKKITYCHGAQHGIFWKMLFALNTVSVLTLIDVPVCFPLLLQTEKHTQEWLLSAWRSETKTAPFCCFFFFFFPAHH